MAKLIRQDDQLLVRLSGREKLAGLHGDVRVPLAAVREVRVEEDAMGAVRGLRAPGYSMPGHAKIGTWRRRRGRSFVVVRHGVPAVRVRLSGAGFDELLVSDPDAHAVVAELRGAGGG